VNNKRQDNREFITREVVINNLLKGHALDVSPGGMFINVSTAMKKGTPVTLKLSINKHPLVINAIVKHASPGIGIGVQFIDLDEDKADLITEFMEQCRQEREEIDRRGGKPVILFVDDRPESIRQFERQLILAGYEIIHARNGIEAVKKLDANKVDLVITDLLMEGMNGFMLVHFVKHTPKFGNIPVAVLSAASGGDSDIKRASRLGIERFFMKHITKPNVFAEEVAKILRRAKRRPAPESSNQENNQT
jgi:CheY-like chemotaxis protein